VRSSAAAGARAADKEHDVEELQRLLRRSDGEKFDVGEKEGKLLGDEELEILLDRSDEAYERAEKGLDVGGDGSVFKAVGKRDEGALMEGLRA
jgi:ATP-dependent DNA helicase